MFRLINGVLLFFVLTSFSNASSLYVQCDTCNTKIDFYEAALLMLDNPESQENIFLVSNTNTGKMYKFFMLHLGGSGLGSIIDYQVMKSTTEEERLNENIFSSMRSLKNINFDVPDSVAGSIYDVIGLSHIENRVIDEYLNDISITEKIFNLMSSLGIIAQHFIDVNFQISMRFSDGSIGHFDVTGYAKGGDLRLKLDSGVDSNGNNVVLKKKNLSGPTNFYFENLASYHHFIDAYGRIEVFSIMDVGETNCVNDDAGGMICTYTTYK